MGDLSFLKQGFVRQAVPYRRGIETICEIKSEECFTVLRQFLIEKELNRNLASVAMSLKSNNQSRYSN